MVPAGAVGLVELVGAQGEFAVVQVPVAQVGLADGESAAGAVLVPFLDWQMCWGQSQDLGWIAPYPGSSSLPS